MGGRILLTVLSTGSSGLVQLPTDAHIVVPNELNQPARGLDELRVCRHGRVLQDMLLAAGGEERQGFRERLERGLQQQLRQGDGLGQIGVHRFGPAAGESRILGKSSSQGFRRPCERPVVDPGASRDLQSWPEDRSLELEHRGVAAVLPVECSDPAIVTADPEVPDHTGTSLLFQERQKILVEEVAKLWLVQQKQLDRIAPQQPKA
jgi:hypothetical protein